MDSQILRGEFNSAKEALDKWPDRMIDLRGDYHRLLELLGSDDALQQLQFIHPHNFAGNLDHYHHNFGAVFLPLIELLTIGVLPRGGRVALPDCGPVQDEGHEFLKSYGIEVNVYPRKFLNLVQRVPGCSHLHLPSYDLSYQSDWWLKPHQIEMIREAVFRFAGVEPGADASEIPRVLLIDRAPPAEYYNRKGSSTGTSGAQRRSIPNCDEIQAELNQFCEVDRVFLEHLTLRDKIARFQRADVVVGQMGAGMNGLLWARPGVAVVEIHPLDHLHRDFAVYGNMASRLGLIHYRIIQGKPHDPVNPSMVAAFVKHASNTAKNK